MIQSDDKQFHISAVAMICLGTVQKFGDDVRLSKFLAINSEIYMIKNWGQIKIMWPNFVLNLFKVESRNDFISQRFAIISLPCFVFVHLFIEDACKLTLEVYLTVILT